MNNEPVDYETELLEYVNARRDPPAYTDKLTADDAERWPIEAAKLGLPRAEIERRIAERRAGSDQFNNLAIQLDHPGTGDTPAKKWHPLAAGVALLLDDSKNPEILFHQHRKKVQAAWIKEARAERRREHEYGEIQRKRDVESNLRQAFSRAPIATAFAAAYENLCVRLETATGKERDALVAQRDLLYILLPFVFLSESGGRNLSFLPSKRACEAVNLEHYEYRKFSE